jgi:DNA (cytosine-5)-methyltransferase 1
MSLTAGGLFEGIGGLTLALEQFGIQTVWCSEIDPHASSVLERHWPDVPNFGDITKIDWESVPPVDVLHGGFPCQDISLVGKGAGIAEGTRSGLWTEYVRAIRTLRPRLVFVENVAALLVRGFDRVITDLAELGYDAQWTCLRASDVGAPHRRNRLWIVASDADRERREGRAWKGGAATGRRQSANSDSDISSDANSSALREQSIAIAGSESTPRLGLDPQIVANTNSDGRKRQSKHHGQSIEALPQEQLRDDTDRLVHLAWGEYEPAIRRWEGITRPAPDPQNNGHLNSTFVEWMMGYPEGWTQGFRKSARLRMLGNAVVPQCASAAFARLIQPIEVAA